MPKKKKKEKRLFKKPEVEIPTLDKVLEEASTRKMVKLQRDLLLDLFLWLTIPFVMISVMFAGLMMKLSFGAFVGTLLVSIVGTTGLIQTYKSWISKKIAGKYIHNSLYITPNKVYSIEWSGFPITETEFVVDGQRYYLNEIKCDEDSDIPYMLVVTPCRFNEAFSYFDWVKFYKGATTTVKMAWDTLVQMEVLPVNIKEENGIPIPVAFAFDCDYNRRNIMKSVGQIPTTDVVTTAVKKFDELESIRYKNLLSLKEARIKELESSLSDHREMAGKTVAKFLHDYNMFGEITGGETKKQSLWERASVKMKMLIIVGICALIIGTILGVIIG